ncbi:hypothetical protein BMBphi_gp002 [Bacillus phage vB_BthS_BMBphi]|nr:hypothetical protein BMBphi_gp002 [Bacillus phage vB_BthS_BMBphi]
MKFEKDIAQLTFHYLDGSEEHATISEFNLNPLKLNKMMFRQSNDKSAIKADQGFIFTENLTSISFHNYEELLEMWNLGGGDDDSEE